MTTARELYRRMPSEYKPDISGTDAAARRNDFREAYEQARSAGATDSEARAFGREVAAQLGGAQGAWRNSFERDY